MKRASNDFDLFLNECQIYVWEWYIPEQKVRFGIPSLNSLWLDDRSKNIKLDTMLERVHPDDIQKVLVRHTSPLYRSDKMFEVDLRLNVAAELMPDGKDPSGKYEWYGFRGKTVRRDKLGRPTYVRGVAINLDERYRAQKKLISQKERQLQKALQKTDYCKGVMQEVGAFLRTMAESANTFIGESDVANPASRLNLVKEISSQAEHIVELTDKFRQFVGERDMVEDEEIRLLPLWEHLAELQQIFSLKAPFLKIHFNNVYDQRQLYVNVKLFDVLLENLMAPQRMLHSGGDVTLGYEVLPDEKTVQLTVLSAPNGNPLQTQDSASAVMGISICKLLAKRLCGSFQMKRLPKGQLQYFVSLPLDAREDIIAFEEDPKEDELEDRSMLPFVLIGLSGDTEMFQNQHLYEVNTCDETSKMLEVYEKTNPDIVFIDQNLSGKILVDDVISRMSVMHPDTPIIVLSDEADRSYHKKIQQLGARYLLTNPLTLRKVNMMIKKYLK